MKDQFNVQYINNVVYKINCKNYNKKYWLYHNILKYYRRLSLKPKSKSDPALSSRVKELNHEYNFENIKVEGDQFI